MDDENNSLELSGKYTIKELSKMDLITIKELYKNREQYFDKEVTIGGWVRSNRDSKTFGFIITILSVIIFLYIEYASTFKTYEIPI